MIAYTEKVREIARKLLQECTVEMVIGFRAGSQPMMNEPCFIKKADDADKLIWDGNCGINLANYLTDRKEKIAVFAKGCDSRNIVTHIIENKIERDNLVIIGVPCTGMIDKRLVAARAEGEIASVSETGDKVVVKLADGRSTEFDRREVLQSNCALCVHRNPVIYDQLVADLVEEQTDVDRWADVREIEQMDIEKRRRFFEDLLAPCIRCYACRNACPLCYCPTCFVDESKPQWLGKGQDQIDVQTFHFLRAFHCAGRCTDCGACQRACPVGINMRLLTKKLEKDCFENYQWEAGMSLDQRPAMDTYKPDDPAGFIK